MKKINSIVKRMKKIASEYGYDTSLVVEFEANYNGERIVGEFEFPDDSINRNYEDYKIIYVDNSSFNTKRLKNYDIEEIYDYAVKLDKLDISGLNIVEAIIDMGEGDLFKAIDNLDDYMFIDAASPISLGYNYIDEIGGLDELEQNTLEEYFDYEAFGNDLILEDEGILNDEPTEYADKYIEAIGGLETLDETTLEEYFDYEAFGKDLKVKNGVKITNGTPIEVANRYIDEIGGLSVLDKITLEEYFDYEAFGDKLILEDEGISNDEPTEYADKYIEMLGGIGALDEITLKTYFDYETFGKDLALDFYETKSGYVKEI